MKNNKVTAGFNWRQMLFGVDVYTDRATIGDPLGRHRGIALFIGPLLFGWKWEVK